VIISPFPRFSLFLAIFQIIQCLCLLFHVFFGVSCHIQGSTVCVSHFPHFNYFSPSSRSYHVSFSFFFYFPGILFNARCYSVHFSFSTFFSVTRHITDPILCFFHFPRFSFFSP
jgi:hypothetical protein